MSRWPGRPGMRLSPNEAYVIERLCAGKQYAEIAREMGLSYHGAAGCSTRICEKLGASTMWEACVIYDRQRRKVDADK